MVSEKDGVTLVYVPAGELLMGYGVSPRSNPQGSETGTYRLLRGGSWDYDVHDLRVASRGYGPTAQYYFLGFRCVAALGK